MGRGSMSVRLRRLGGGRRWVRVGDSGWLRWLRGRRRIWAMRDGIDGPWEMGEVPAVLLWGGAAVGRVWRAATAG